MSNWNGGASAFYDFLPTTAHLTGQPTPDRLDGVSMLPTLLQQGKQRQHDCLYWEFHELKGRVAIRQGNWNGVRYDVCIDPDSPLELYDLAQDPSESVNIASQHPEIVRALDAAIKGPARSHPSHASTSPPNPAHKPPSAGSDQVSSIQTPL